jgi:enamidase
MYENSSTMTYKRSSPRGPAAARHRGPGRGGPQPEIEEELSVTRLLIRNIGTLLSGDCECPVLDADQLVVEDGLIVSVGDARGDGADVDQVLDAQGLTVMPGLLDNHVHPVIGDYTPRQRQSDYLEGFVHGGVTTGVSAGEVHLPGRPKDASGTKALAVLAAKAFGNVRPGGFRMHAGALLLEPGLVEEDFPALAADGVHLVGEIGISGVKDVDECAQLTRWAQAAGMTVMVHVGGASVPGSGVIDGEFVVAVRPDVAAHVNGGPTSPTLEDVELILRETQAALEVVHNGNVRAALDVARLLAAEGSMHRLVIGTDSPAGSGVQPLGILRTLSWLTSMAGVPAADAVAAATGNTARVRRLDTGTVGIGAPADLVVVDAPLGSRAKDFCSALEVGDTPAVAMVLIDGRVVVTRSRNTPPPTRTPSLTSSGHGSSSRGHRRTEEPLNTGRSGRA